MSGADLALAGAVVFGALRLGLLLALALWGDDADA